ncbi:SagB family peptide dehydrogenase [Chamaesiphon sp.]|uniref:SagB/ThcOx family dehydrogenase n=1 Tax=Chamaesiphon sp. TaxID=2814140 RepID=UPI0035942AB8
MSDSSNQQHVVISILETTLVEIAPFATQIITPDPPDPNHIYTLSRFAYIHTQDSQMVLESPLAHCRVILHDRQSIDILHALSSPQTLTQLSNQFADIPQAIVSTLLSWLLGAEFLTVSDKNGTQEEEPSLQLWEFHDLLFHARSRLGRHNYPYGKSDAHLGKIAPLPAVKSSNSLLTIPLDRPNIEAIIDLDLPFTQVMEQRRSHRLHGKQPITIEQLGEFLFRTTRIRSIETNESVEYEFSDRPYPSGGACYELELYLAINACQGIEPGFYHYCPREHLLRRLSGSTVAVYQLSCQAAIGSGLPQILIIFTARFPRVTWKYHALAYALILKHVGVLYQSMYLVATAMELAPCAIGGGNSDLFAQATGINYLDETSIGEFILGSKSK